MKALVWYGKNDVRYEDAETPGIEDDEILMKVAYAGICGAEMHIIEERVDPVAIHSAPPPQVLGHEFSGIVTKVGSRRQEYMSGGCFTCKSLRDCRNCRRYFANDHRDELL